MGVYDKAFYSSTTKLSLNAARKILPLVFEIAAPDSVFDFGCGSGAWLAAARELGVENVSGIDGPWVDAASLIIAPAEFQAVDFEKDSFSDIDDVDLALSIEVLEHLSDETAKRLLSAVAGRAKFILLSVAIPFQGGRNHINEQWQSYYAGYLNGLGYVCWDALRPQLWNDASIPFWLKQNLLLFVRDDIAKDFPIPDTRQLDVVHPDNYIAKIRKHKSDIESEKGKRIIKRLRKYIGFGSG
ncbi:class I SAM-dependent methyltransferase [Nitratireductor sp. XY-223]|uniref:class I SAM-dependent methyltransferase n=1 Tax=Nitratireductor sp. XY-223 TaxID=2561926 RepID=UPI0010AA147C|nr:class I SAM-dependent methyltransferase [Nitratireductor sp. XY-223]